MEGTKPNAVFFIGLPCAGKSTWLSENAERFRDYVEVCADEIKKTYYGYDETMVSMFANRAIRDAKKMFLETLDKGQNVILDGGGINNKYTLTLMNAAKAKGYTITLVNMDTPAWVCLERNQQRTRKVPERIIVDKEYKRSWALGRLKESGLVDELINVNYFTNKHIFFDMDGVLAAQKGLPVVNGEIDFVNSKYYTYLPPVWPVIDKAKALMDAGKTIYIMTAIPTCFSADEKREWVAKYMPWFPKDKFLWVNSGQYKAEFFRDVSKRFKLELKDMLLVEDTHKIIRQVNELGGKSIHVSEFITTDIADF